MNKKISIAVVFFVIVLFGGSLALLFFMGGKNKTNNVEVSNTVQKKTAVSISSDAEVTNWSVYQNTAYNYELEYPTDWKIETTFGADPKTFSAPNFSLANCSDSDICPSFTIGNVHEIEAGESIENKINLNSNDKIIAQGEMEVSGEKASFVEYYQASYGRKDGGMGLVRQEIKVIHKNTMYRFYIDEYNPDINMIKTSADWKYKKVFEYMLESFNFIDVDKIEDSLSAEEPSQSLNNKEELTSLFADNHGKNESEVAITIKKENGDFVRGGVEFSLGGPDNSGMFLAKKINGEWIVAYEGNGVPDCSSLKNDYGFSSDMLEGVCD